MNRDQARAAVAACLAGIAPEVDLGTVDPRARLRDEIDLDSLDFLSLVEALYERTGVSIPESAYASVGTLDGLEGYLVAHAATARTG